MATIATAIINSISVKPAWRARRDAAACRCGGGSGTNAVTKHPGYSGLAESDVGYRRACAGIEGAAGDNFRARQQGVTGCARPAGRRDALRPDFDSSK
ncbi:MAG: hypothetical protein JSR43_13665 [Proteobacteria bacterium]|nr:hypothetical protein [Pseudomonadota bacterium]